MTADILAGHKYPACCNTCCWYFTQRAAGIQAAAAAAAHTLGFVTPCASSDDAYSPQMGCRAWLDSVPAAANSNGRRLISYNLDSCLSVATRQRRRVITYSSRFCRHRTSTIEAAASDSAPEPGSTVCIAGPGSRAAVSFPHLQSQSWVGSLMTLCGGRTDNH